VQKKMREKEGERAKKSEIESEKVNQRWKKTKLNSFMKSFDF